MSRPSGISVKSIGLIVAAILATIFGVIIWISISNSTPPTNPNADFFPADPTEIPNIEDTQTGGAMLVTMVDKDDPTRIAGTLKADRFEPIGEGRRRLDNPESWIYLKDGRTVKITADTATMLMPDPNQPPESGTLEGNITIEAFESVEMLDKPIMTAHFDEPVEFERRYLRLRSPGHFDITSDQFDFSGSDLTIILNELRNRVELIDVVQGDQIVIHTDATKPTPVQTNPQLDQQTAQQANSQPTQPSVSTTQPSTTQTAIAEPTTPDPIADTLSRYHITLADEVIALITGSGSATADRLELWATLDDGNLPADAIKTISFAQQSDPDTQSSPRASSQPSSQPSTQPSTQQATAPQSASNNDIVITWSGKMTVRPIDGDIPSQLVDNDLTLTLAANENKGIIFEVPAQNFIGQAFAATYHATQGTIELVSKQSQDGYIELKAADTGSLVATSLRADLTTGKIDLLSRGQITTTPSDPNDNATIRWKDSASFTLAMVNNELSDRLTSAHFEGAVMAKQAGNSVGARILDAKFDPALPASNSLKKLSMTNAVLSSASKSLLTGSTLEIDFVPGTANNPLDPIRLVADGKVMGRDPESMLKTEHLVVTMFRDLAGDMVVRTANAKGAVAYTGVDRTTANGDTLDADAINETMTLLGSPARVAQAGSSIVGDHINMNARRRSVEVLGPGSFDHDIALDESDPNADVNALAKGHIRATWKGSMRFDDALGSVICEDDVRVVSTPDAYTRDTLDAHRAEIKLTPMPTADPIANRGQPERELISARIFGYAPPGQDPIPAKIESRTYDQNDPERVIGLIYLDGPQILVNNQAQTLDVPAPGTLLILDRSEDENTTADTSKTGPGLTRFTWQGRMNLNRAQGTARFTDQVVVRQKTISTGKIAELNTDQLDARFEIGQQNPISEQDQSTRLLGVDAVGSVRFLFEGRELLADSAIYDAISDSLFASAIDNKLVTIYDEADPAPKSAKTIRWDLAKDRIEINAPTPTRSIGG